MSQPSPAGDAAASNSHQPSSPKQQTPLTGDGEYHCNSHSDLIERLRVSDEWNLRLQTQIQELLRLPRSDVVALRARMQTPDIAIPLLQCYDAAIAEKSDEVAALLAENTKLRQQAQGQATEQAALAEAVRVAEGMAAQLQSKAREEVARWEGAVKGLQAELAQHRQESLRALESETEARERSEGLVRQVAVLREEISSLKEEAERDAEARRLLETRLRLREQADGAEAAESESTHIELQLLRQQNRERLEELEGLRGKMVAALRQSADNHAAHLRLVEERHRLAIEELQAAQRTQELEVLKLRAQLARADPANPAGGAQRHSFLSTTATTTTELLEAQTRQAQEAELKRLHAEVAGLQVQRDDAVLRYEQLSAHLRRDREQQEAEFAREARSLQSQLDNLRQKLARAEEAEASGTRQAAALKERLRAANAEAADARLARDTAMHELTESRRREAESQRLAGQVSEEKDRAVAAERERRKQAEQRVTTALEELRALRETAQEEAAAAERGRHHWQQQHTVAVTQLREAERNAAELVRQRAVQEGHLSRLTEAVEAHRKRLADMETRAAAAAEFRMEAESNQRAALLAIEQLKCENHRLVKTRNRLTEVLQTRAM